MRLFSTKKAKKGFTLIELLVVIAIIGLLSTIVLASLGTARSKGVTASNQMALQQVKNALALYAADNNGTYPATTTALVLGKYISAINPNIAYTPLDSDNNPCSTEPCSDYMLSISSGGSGSGSGVPCGDPTKEECRKAQNRNEKNWGLAHRGLRFYLCDCNPRVSFIEEGYEPFYRYGHGDRAVQTT